MPLLQSAAALAGDRRGVEGVPHPQEVGGHADAHAEALLAQAEVLGSDDGHEDAPADDVQGGDECEDGTQPGPVGGGDGTAHEGRLAEVRVGFGAGAGMIGSFR
ncbi:hypothetical protein [Streptomyces sp. NPDC059862]|uniref:hypothetical protein n=1 Tax=unclassified Streptomyces TaxID=2593676 RepID=UPI0036408463